jgi:thiamine-monophosphate kinase
MKEKDIILLFKKIAKTLPPSSFVKKGIDDDTAVLCFGKNLLLLTTDLFIEDIHFRSHWMPAFALGYKALSINISDIAAMGGKPLCFCISMGFPKAFLKEAIDEFLKGLKKAAQTYGVTLIGGDTVEAQKIIIDITLLGLGQKGKVLFRSSAKPGDLICVSDYLGQAAAGLALLESGYKGKDRFFLSLINTHLYPKAEISLGQYLAQSGLIHALIDVSDGIGSDLTWVCCQSRVGARIYQQRLPISFASKKAAKRFNIDVFDWALSGGEDYCLLFTVPEKGIESLRKNMWKKLKRKFFIIGEIIKGNKVYFSTNVKEIDITGKGFSFFK